MPWKNVPTGLFHRLFYPVVAVIVSAEWGDRVGAMPAISCMPISFGPPMVGVSIQPGHTTYHLIESSGCFALNWLDLRYAKSIEFLGSGKHYEGRNKLEAAGLHTQRGRKIPAPIVSEASAVLEAEVERKVETGDHHLFLSRVVDVYADPDFEDYWRLKKYKPALYSGGHPTGKGLRFVKVLER